MPIKRKNKSLKGGGNPFSPTNPFSTTTANRGVGQEENWATFPNNVAPPAAPQTHEVCPKVHADDRLHHYFIKSSHNSYLTTDQHSIPDVCTVETYHFPEARNICYKGGCIEIDIVKIEGGHIYVGHCIPTVKLSGPKRVAVPLLRTAMKRVLISCAETDSLNLITVLEHLRDKYLPSESEKKMPLIITLDINQIEGQKTHFNNIFYRILLKVFKDSRELRCLDENLVNENTELSSLTNKILFRVSKKHKTHETKHPELMATPHADYNNTTPLIGSNNNSLQSINHINQKDKCLYDINILNGKTEYSYTLSVTKDGKATPEVPSNAENRLIRTYPKTTLSGDMSSDTNYNPAPYLLQGISLISLNLQFIDKFSIGYMGFFDKSNYIKKPESDGKYRNKQFNPFRVLIIRFSETPKSQSGGDNNSNVPLLHGEEGETNQANSYIRIENRPIKIYKYGNRFGTSSEKTNERRRSNSSLRKSSQNDVSSEGLCKMELSDRIKDVTVSFRYQFDSDNEMDYLNGKNTSIILPSVPPNSSFKIIDYWLLLDEKVNKVQSNPEYYYGYVNFSDDIVEEEQATASGGRRKNKRRMTKKKRKCKEVKRSKKK